MSAEAKRVKILTLIELVLGLAIVVTGVVLVVLGAASAAPFVLCGEGVLTLVFGARAALIANVPARIGKLVSLALIVLLLQIACLVGIVFLIGPDQVSQDPIPVFAAALPAVFSVTIALLSNGIAKRAER
ncbi:MAG: hypothetical protein J6S63_06085 [Atopobiaceae bacterium]|nr:hypothetical protein [Atopobiaceae bacterium]